MNKLMLAIMCSLIIALVGFQVISPSGKALTIDATIDIDPDTLNLNRKGNWITGYIELPEGYNVSDIDPESILLDDLFRIAWSNREDNALMVKFDAERVIEYLWDRLLHMGGQRAHLDLTIKGQLEDKTQFIGMDTITVMIQGS
ncbi:MAG TPA: hypothetical protein VJ249_02885 [Candidatus Bathyarchaeia archaeon]|nr:hypothetical protein [Candidatus Bathyarchaeia archaeon]